MRIAENGAAVHITTVSELRQLQPSEGQVRPEDVVKEAREKAEAPRDPKKATVHFHRHCDQVEIDGHRYDIGGG